MAWPPCLFPSFKSYALYAIKPMQSSHAGSNILWMSWFIPFLYVWFFFVLFSSVALIWPSLLIDWALKTIINLSFSSSLNWMAERWPRKRNKTAANLRGRVSEIAVQFPWILLTSWFACYWPLPCAFQQTFFWLRNWKKKLLWEKWAKLLPAKGLFPVWPARYDDTHLVPSFFMHSYSPVSGASRDTRICIYVTGK